MFCSHCGKSHSTTARFCTNCGRELALSIPSCENSHFAPTERITSHNKNDDKPKAGISIVMIIGGIIGYLVGSILASGLNLFLKTKGATLSAGEAIIGVIGYGIMIWGALCVLWGIKRLIAISNYPEPSKHK